MTILNTREVRTNLLQLLDRVAKGEEFIIARAGQPIARLVGFSRKDRDRTGGHWNGLVHIGDDFDDALPDEIAGSLGELA